MHRVYLPFGTGIGRPPVTVKSALIANTDTCLIIIFGTYMQVTHTYDITGKVKTLVRNRKLVQKNKQ